METTQTPAAQAAYNDLMLWFETPQELKDMLERMAWEYAGSKNFDILKRSERANWLFNFTMLLRYLDAMHTNFGLAKN